MADDASAVADNQVLLNMESKNLQDTPKGRGQVLTTSSMLPTSKLSVEQILHCETQATDIQIAFDTEVGTVLYSTPVGPGVLNTDTTTRVEWMSKLFKFWRGTHEFRFVFTKSILQQMKLMAVFVPGATTTSAPPTPAQAIYYSHHLIMNPANETEATITVPFVNPQPFLEMDSSTGMFYVLLYQPLISSFDTSTNPSFIYVKMFVAAKLEMHEFVPLPPINSISSTDVIPSSAVWSVCVASGSAGTYGGTTGNTSLLTDDGFLVAVPTNASITLAGNMPGDIRAYTPIGVKNGNDISAVYNPKTCATLYGSPSGLANGRVIMIIAEDVAAGAQIAGQKNVMVLCCVNTTGCFLTSFSNTASNAGWKAFSAAMFTFETGVTQPLNGSYQTLFPIPFTTMEELVADMRNELRREMFRSEMIVEFGKAHGDEHSETCECDECKLWNKVFFTKWSFPSPGQIVESLPCCSRCDSQSDCWECDEEENQCLLDSRLYRYECGDCGATMTGSLDEQPDQFCSTCILEQANPSEIVEPVGEYYTSCGRCDQVVVQQLDADFQNLCADCQYVEASGLDMSLETSRLLTFASWKNANASPIDLAKTGFYYLGVSDCVRCEACQVTVSDWQPEDVPEECHLKFSPNCSYFSAPEKGWQYVMEHGVVHEKFPETTPEFYKQDFRLVTSSDDRLCRCCLSNVFPNLYEITHF